MKRILCPALFLVFGMTILSAQQVDGGRRNLDPVQMADRQTNIMVDMLALSEAQARKVREVNLSFAEQMTAARADHTGDFQAMREHMLQLRLKQAEELKKYLTTEQYATWEAYQNDRKKTRRQKRPKKDKGRNQ